MPFPFNKLPYGLRQRLRELSTSIEAYNLQTAVGNDIPGLQPLIQIKSCDQMWLAVDNDLNIFQLTVYTKHIKTVYSSPDDIENTLFSARHVFVTADVKDFMHHPLLDNFHCFGRTLDISSTALSHQQLEFIAQKVSKVTYLNTKTSFTFPQLFTLFPDIKTLRMPSVYTGWLHDLLNIDKPGLNFATEDRGQDFDEVFSFESDDLVKLFQKMYTLYVCCAVHYDSALADVKTACKQAMDAATKKIVDHIGPRFVCHERILTVERPSFNVTLLLQDVDDHFPTWKELMFTLHEDNGSLH